MLQASYFFFYQDSLLRTQEKLVVFIHTFEESFIELFFILAFCLFIKCLFFLIVFMTCSWMFDLYLPCNSWLIDNKSKHHQLSSCPFIILSISPSNYLIDIHRYRVLTWIPSNPPGSWWISDLMSTLSAGYQSVTHTCTCPESKWKK